MLILFHHSDKTIKVPVQLVNIEGNVFAEKLFSCNAGENKLRLDLTNVPKGYYLVKLHTPGWRCNGKAVQKIRPDTHYQILFCSEGKNTKQPILLFPFQGEAAKHLQAQNV